MISEKADVVVVGGGHNGLVAAAYLAKAGKKVVVLERLDYFGGAATSIAAFDSVAANLSRYSYLVSLLPDQIVQDLGLEMTLAPRRYSSYTPDPFGSNGLLIDKESAEQTEASFAAIGSPDFAAWNNFYGETTELAQKLFPTVLKPLERRSEVLEKLGQLSKFIEKPIGTLITETFVSDLVRGVVMTDALIGTFADNLDGTMAANRCFLYHVIGGETGDWNIPVGGMGAVTKSMRLAAERFGAELVANAEVVAVDPNGTVKFRRGGEVLEIRAEFVLANLASAELDRLLGKAKRTVSGSQVKVNMLLKRLPKLKSEIDSTAAFGGTFHINENFSQLQEAFEAASAGNIPSPLP